MELVENYDQILENIYGLEAALECPELSSMALSVIKRGTCFVAYKRGNRPAFAPSKFVGYVDNDLPSYFRDRGTLDGRDTNEALDQIFGFSPSVDIAAEDAYVEFCHSLNFTPSERGNYGKTRRFWVLPELRDYFTEKAVNEIQADPNIPETQKEQLVKARVGQGQFRKDLLNHWGECCLTGCSLVDVLKASHIKPWCKSDNRERLDKFNGLLLSPNADALFDLGYISFSDAGELLFSPQIPELTVKVLLGECRAKISVKKPHKIYLAYHREYRFRKDVA